MRAAEDGFSLIEALVAMMILAVASAGLIRAAEGHVDTIRGLERRTTAQWVAENGLVEAGLPESGASGQSDVEMLGSRWRVDTRFGSSEDADLRTVEVAVTAPRESTPTIVLNGFADAGTTTVKRTAAR